MDSPFLEMGSLRRRWRRSAISNWTCGGPGWFLHPASGAEVGQPLWGRLDDVIMSPSRGRDADTREVRHHLVAAIGTELSHETISKITGAALEQPYDFSEIEIAPLPATRRDLDMAISLKS